jgi:hypothetical protein
MHLSIFSSFSVALVVLADCPTIVKNELKLIP